MKIHPEERADVQCPNMGGCAWEFVIDDVGDPDVHRGVSDHTYWECETCGLTAPDAEAAG